MTEKGRLCLAASQRLIVAATVFASLAFGTDTATKTVTVKPCGDKIFDTVAGDHYPCASIPPGSR